MTVKVGISGFGRIGRCTLSSIIESGREDIQVVKMNATGPINDIAHLLKYDSVHGRFAGDIKIDGDMMDVGQGAMKVFSTYNPEELDWSGCDVVLECSGKFNSKEASEVHIRQGAKKVLVSAPATNADVTIVHGVNSETLTADDLVVSNGSCTTNCLAPMAKAINDAIGIESGIMTTIHSYTGDQPTLDRRHKDLYRARAAAMSMIPTSTGAAKAIGLVLPELNGKLDGSAIRVPTPNVSAVDLTFMASKDVTAEEVNAAVEAAANGAMKGIMSYETEKKVSVDYNHNTHSCNFAADQTKVMGGRLVRVLGWYDNEWGFSCRMADNAVHMGTI
ncbi:type I glyceraldehyde-3-phosphate dehydrogenase [Alisedimentitalea sp. MJ-SS2]|uniref:type I glyceraldehyde-3-phosphate dehydrogenase n=1 Tax=Aliisedimentitalea sp. MJ-SS2 TaxID=3049795 RepID=UPI002907B7D4|nr:type I glyceraldehyde-3-phosphate dehydrogenase [Alisedimentitalea sp. MJ-SS2]MDU8928146.1 type I glyceraldehyde-3-phosphate dehydrogenase [Alisedimentitalea sp. MJ-SS2]